MDGQPPALTGLHGLLACRWGRRVFSQKPGGLPSLQTVVLSRGILQLPSLVKVAGESQDSWRAFAT